jgi:hypothetical protein
MVFVKREDLNSVILVDSLLSPWSVRMPGYWPRAVGVAISAFSLSWPGGHWGRG